MALFVLGAGATRGSSFVEPKANPCLPPLDADFFTQVQRLRKPANRKLAGRVLKRVVETFGSNFRVTLESVFSTYEQGNRLNKVIARKPIPGLVNYLISRIELEQLIGAMFEESMTVRGKNGEATLQPSECAWHRKLVTEIIRPGDTVISFNYDCLMDHALKTWGSGKWNAKYGYCIPLRRNRSGLVGWENWQPQTPSTRQETVKLLKLHGSLHFQVATQTGPTSADNFQVRLKMRPYARLGPRQIFSIIPPESSKRYDEGVFARLWRRAADELRKATDIIVIGYSLPQTDLHTTSLFRTCLRAKSLASLVVVNPEDETRHRIRSVMQAGLSGDTRVLSVGKFEEFVAIRREVWSDP